MCLNHAELVHKNLLRNLSVVTKLHLFIFPLNGAKWLVFLFLAHAVAILHQLRHFVQQHLWLHEHQIGQDIGEVEQILPHPTKPSLSNTALFSHPTLPYLNKFSISVSSTYNILFLVLYNIDDTLQVIICFSTGIISPLLNGWSTLMSWVLT